MRETREQRRGLQIKDEQLMLVFVARSDRGCVCSCMACYCRRSWPLWEMSSSTTSSQCTYTFFRVQTTDIPRSGSAFSKNCVSVGTSCRSMFPHELTYGVRTSSDRCLAILCTEAWNSFRLS